VTLHVVSEAGIRHTFLSSSNPRTTSCARCGKSAGDTIHAYVDLAHRASVCSHLTVAANHASAGDFGEAVREAKVAIRLAGLED
jgi:hypothetical protein